MTRGLETADVRLGNKRSLVELLYWKKEATRQELLTEMHVSAPTFWSVLRELQEAGLVVDGEQLQAKNGRKPTTLRFDYSVRTALGIELYNELAWLVLTDLSGAVLAQQKITFDEITEGVDYGELFANSDALSKRVKEFLSEHVPEPEHFLGIGIALHGYVQDGLWVRSDKSIATDEIKKYFDYPVFFGGTAHLAGFAEVWMKSIRDAVYLTIGNGVGGAIIQDGEVFAGKNNRAGDMGHFVVEANGKKCICGRRGCFATKVSLYEICQTWGFESFQSFMDALKAGDEKAAQIWEQYLKDLAGGLCSLSSILDQDILIGGRIVELLRNDMPRLKQAMEAQNTPGNVISSEIYLSDFDENTNVSAVGAALSVVANYLKDVS